MACSGDMADEDVTRRTWLAAERTWLAWWRTALGAAVAALAVGRLAPELTGGTTWPWAIVGTGYALLAIAMFVGRAHPPSPRRGGARGRDLQPPRPAGRRRDDGRRRGLLALSTIVLIVFAL